MVGRTRTPTKAQRLRFARIKWLGCIACRIEGAHGVPPEIHHITEGGRRLGHDYTIGLCVWHHRGQSELPAHMAELRFGPSLARSKRDFVARYGTERELLSHVNDLLDQEASWTYSTLS